MNALTALRPVDGQGTWEHSESHRELRLTYPGMLVVCCLLGLLFGLLYSAGQKAVCAMDRAAYGEPRHSYCEGWKNPAVTP